MPADRRRSSPARRSVAALAVLVVAACATACVGEPVSGPTPSSVNFEPKLIIGLDEQITFVAGPREDPAVATDPPSVPGGTVVEIVNDGDAPQRLQGGRGGADFDTGTLLPGENTIVVLTNDTESDRVLALSTTEAPDLDAELTVRPRTAA